MNINQISIHALVKRATIADELKKLEKENFNPRPREEGDIRTNVYNSLLRHFNPRPREEGDGVGVGVGVAMEKFQSTPS